MIRYQLRKILMTLLFLFLLVNLSSCDLAVPPFSGGIRVISIERLILVGNSEFPSSGDVNTGVEIFIIGPGTGTQTSFAGVTGANGISDYPNARTNATWTVSLASSLGCVFSPTTINVHVQGADFTFTCFVF